MNDQGLTISINTLEGVPAVTVTGVVDACRAESLEDVMESFLLDDTPGVMLDITQASFSDIEGASMLVRMLRIVSRDMKVTVAASPKISTTLKHAGLEPYLTMYSSLDHVHESGARPEEFLTSRWMARNAEDEELPLAA